MDMLEDFPRGVTTRNLNEHRTPLAAWMRSDVIASSPALSYDPAKIFLGKLNGKAIGIADDRHIVTIAGSRAGKGVSAIVPNLILYEGSVLAIDPKAELAGITARRRAEGLGQQVYVLDPFGRAAKWVAPYKASYNPLSILRPDSRTLVEDAGLIADALVIAGGPDPHWDDSARNFIEGVILHVATYPGYEGRRDLVTVRRLLMNGAAVEYGDKTFRGMPGLEVEMQHNVELFADGRDGAAENWRDPEAAAAAIEAAAADFFDKEDRERASVLSTARRHTKFLDFPNLQAVLRGHDFDLTMLKTAPKGMTVYLCLPVGRLATCSRWFRLFVNLALEAMEREAGKPPVPVLLCLDEFAALGHMRQIEAAAGQIAGFGVKLWPILQDLTQLKRDYKEGWETFLGNAGVLQFFGNNDVTTLEFIGRRLGKTSMVVSRGAQTTHEQRTKGASGESWAVEVHDLLTAEEAARFFGRDDRARRQLIVRAGRDPMVLERAVYYEDSLFTGKYDELAE
jgi:type IV secretion system protein VirD4